MILVIDNYDSFTYNLVQAIGNLTEQSLLVLKNDEVTLADLNRPKLTGLVLSPGPGRPEDAGNMNAVLKAAIGKVPILGVCLGHQAIGEVYGAQVVNAPQLMHGKTDTLTQLRPSKLFHNCAERFTIGRYHSLVIDPQTIPSSLTVTGVASDGTIQSVADDENEVFGVEFHPESIMTDATAANTIFHNFITLTSQLTYQH
ncbi:anthranilate synthase component II [Nicoliella lavandulae]|uniref:Aminodeoxychorismate/anthranilate synthase component II n=1 Tax=Nicoliella lavandulae TaxID=3082954 RepID=A0ABU8SMH6_9LACO